MQYINQNTGIKKRIAYGKFLHINIVYWVVLLQTFPKVWAQNQNQSWKPQASLILEITYNAAWVKDTQNSSLWLYPFLMSIENRFGQYIVQICVYMSYILLIITILVIFPTLHVIRLACFVFRWWLFKSLSCSHLQNSNSPLVSDHLTFCLVNAPFNCGVKWR